MEKPKYHHVDKFSFTCVSGKFRVPPVTTFQDEERSPVFIQFLDCVHQLIYQFRTAFEFDDSLLLFIAHHLYSGRFGNFISNSFKVTSHFIHSRFQKKFQEREDKKLAEKTESIWPFILTNSESFINGHYTKSTIDDVIIPSPSIIKMAFWSRLYAKWDPRKGF